MSTNDSGESYIPSQYGCTMNQGDTVIHYFYGEVVLLEQLLTTAVYIVIMNGAELEIDNDMHIRLVDDQLFLPTSFYIIAPFIAIRRLIGEIPANLVIQRTASEYVRLRQKYHGE